MTINEIIRALKANRTEGKARRFLPEDVQLYLKSHPEGGVHMYTELNRWVPGCCGDRDDGVYSLPPDYPEIPVVTEGWVEIPVDSIGLVAFWVKGYIYAPHWYDHTRIPRETSGLLSHFGGHRWDDGSVTLVIQGYSEHTLTPNANRWVKPATPVALRFWCTDVQKFKAAQKQS